MATVFITGGTSGLGYETARQLVALGYRVIIGARNAEKGALAASELGCDWVLLDVCDDASVDAAAAEVRERFGGIDVLVNNAGVSAPRKDAVALDGPDAERVFQTNVLGIVRMMHAFVPLLEGSGNPVVVNVSSGLGSFAVTGDAARAEAGIVSPLYCASKAAVNMLTRQYARALSGIKVNAVDPGSTKTNLNGGFGMQPVEVGAEVIVQMATIGADGPTGTFRDRTGELGW